MSCPGSGLPRGSLNGLAIVVSAFLLGVAEAMYRNQMTTAVALALTAVALALIVFVGCYRDEHAPMLAGGREVKSWLAALHDPDPRLRRQAVLKLGNVGDADPTAAEGLAEALRDTDALVRRDAIQAVAKLTKPGEAILAQLRALSDRDRDPLVREHAQKAIAHFGAAK